MTDQNRARINAFGTELITVHDKLRDALDDLRDNLGSPDPAVSLRARAMRDLRMQCLAFCTAVTRHHGAEDAVMFPAVAEQFPELRPMLEGLTRDHHFISDILHRVEAAVARLDQGDIGVGTVSGRGGAPGGGGAGGAAVGGAAGGGAAEAGAEETGAVETGAVETGAVDPSTVDSVRAELEGLSAILESHLRWEERRLAQALNDLDLPGLSTASMLGSNS